MAGPPPAELATGHKPAEIKLTRDLSPEDLAKIARITGGEYNPLESIVSCDRGKVIFSGLEGQFDMTLIYPRETQRLPLADTAVILDERRGVVKVVVPPDISPRAPRVIRVIEIRADRPFQNLFIHEEGVGDSLGVDEASNQIKEILAAVDLVRSRVSQGERIIHPGGE